MGDRAAVHRTIHNCSIYFQGVYPNDSARLPNHGLHTMLIMNPLKHWCVPTSFDNPEWMPTPGEPCRPGVRYILAERWTGQGLLIIIGQEALDEASGPPWSCSR